MAKGGRFFVLGRNGIYDGVDWVGLDTLRMSLEEQNEYYHRQEEQKRHMSDIGVN